MFLRIAINKTTLVSLAIIIVLFSSGIAIGVHYSNDSHNLGVSILGPIMAIEGQSVHYNSSVKAGNGPFCYRWFVNSTLYSKSSDANLTFYGMGIHIISLSVSSANGYSGSDMILIRVYSEPDVYISSNLTHIRKGENVTFYSHIVGGMGSYYYTWYSNGNSIGCGFNLSEINHRFNSSGSYNVGLKVNNSLGFSGSTTFNFDPWQFSEEVKPIVRSGFGENNAMANVQLQNASGYLAFHFYLYNPTSSERNDNITISLYPELPSNGPDYPSIKYFTFSSGVIAARNGTWINVYPNIYWNYSSIAVIPQNQTGLSGDSIGVANPANFNNIFSHYWVPGWDGKDDGFAGYWTISHNITLTVL